MNVETVEVLNAPGMGDEHTSSYSQNDIPYGRTETRTTPSSRARRKTGESVNRPNNSQGKPSSGSSSSKTTSAPSTPRPIPKSNKKNLQPSSMSSSYTFDDSIENPFLPSTPPAFTPSMERTGFTKPDSSKPTSSKPTSSKSEFSKLDFSKSDASKSMTDLSKPITSSFTEALKNAPASKSFTPITPSNIEEKPPSFPYTRSRDGSVSSMTGIGRPRHEDMILPAVARRIKEQGLYEHDVVAYSDDYDAPLYKLPSTASNINNPFASYDRAKAASSTSLSLSKSPLSSSTPKADTNFDQRPETTSPVLSPSPVIPDTPNIPSRSGNNVKRNDMALKDETRQEQQVLPPNQFADELESSTDNSTKKSQATSPERPRRTRRNTNRETQEQTSNIDEPRPQRQRRPTMPESPDHNDRNTSDTNQYSEISSPVQYYDQESSSRQDKRSGRNNRSQQNARDEYNMQELSNNNYDYRQNESAQVGYGNRRNVSKAQEQGYNRNDDRQLDNRGDRFTGNNSSRSDGNTHINHSHQYNNNGNSNPNNNNNSNNNRYDSHQGRRNNTQNYDINAPEAAYNSRAGGYSPQQPGFNPQRDNSFPHNNSYENGYGSQAHYYNQNGAINPHNRGQYNEANGRDTSRPVFEQNGHPNAQSRPDAVHVEMPEMTSASKVDATTDGHKDNSKKKKGGVCCVIM